MTELISTANMPTKDGYDAWCAYWSNTCVSWRSTPQSQNSTLSFQGQISAGISYGLNIFSLHQDAHEVTKICSSDPKGDEAYLLFMQTSGECMVSHSRDWQPLHVGDVTLVDCERPVRFRYGENCGQIAIKMEKNAIYDPSSRDDIAIGTVIAGQSGIGKMLAGYTALLSSESGWGPVTPKSDDEKDLAIRNALYDLTRAAVVRRYEPSSSNVAPVGIHLSFVKSWIREHLSDPELNPQSIAQNYGISTRHLHRLFQPTGFSVSEWIRDQRLRASQRDLASFRLRYLDISTICYKWGFNDSAHFSRAFRAAYGESPRAFRLRALTTQRVPNGL